MKSFVVMPAYNAEGSIRHVFERIPERVVRHIDKIIIVNDGSTDKTEKEANKLQARYKRKIIVLNHKKNKGYGAAQKSGFNEALKRNADLVVLLHSDGQYPPELIEQFILPIKRREADIVAGSRTKYGNMLKQGMPFHKYIGNRILTALLNFRFRQNISSYHSGYKAYSINALKTIDFNKMTDYYYFDTEMLIEAARKGLVIKEIPIPTIYGDEKSYLNPLAYGIGIVKFVFTQAIGNRS